METFEQRKNTLAADLEKLGSWEERYKLIIALGKVYPGLEDNMKTEEAKVKGCQSQVWLHARRGEKGEVLFAADSDAILVRGLIAILMNIYNGLMPEEILKNPPEFLKDLGFEQNLSASRANGLNAMIKQMRTFAMAFWMMDQQKKQQ